MVAERALPEGVVQSLRDAFAAERDARLTQLRGSDAQHAAHALASSAWVVGEREISLLARSVEEHLERGEDPVELPALVRALERYAP